jgi:hypothetical protein
LKCRARRRSALKAFAHLPMNLAHGCNPVADRFLWQD